MLFVRGPGALRKRGSIKQKTRPRGWLSRTPVKRISPQKSCLQLFLSHLNFWYRIALLNFDTTRYVTDTSPAMAGVHAGPVCVTRPVRIVRLLLICFSFPHIGVCLRPGLAALGCWSTAVQCDSV